MMELYNYLTIGLSVGLASVGVGLGQGRVGTSALQAVDLQPRARAEIMRTTLIGSALMETGAVLAAALSMLLIFELSRTTSTWHSSFARLGIVLALSVTGLVVGLVSAKPVQAACNSIARQPFAHQRILNMLLIVQAIIQTPTIFGFLIAWFIKSQASSATTLVDSLRLIAAGLTLGLGCIGPAIGLAWFGAAACRALGYNRNCYGRLQLFTLISQAVIETSVIFAVIVALILIAQSPAADAPISYGIGLLAAALAIGIGTLLPGVSSGKVAAAAADQIAIEPENTPVLSKVSMFGQALIDTCAIYALIVALMMILL